MGLTKHASFKDDVNNIADVFKALGHPARIQIMNILIANECCTCGNIVDILPLAQSTVSTHLLELKKANLIDNTYSGKSSIYSIKKDKLNILNKFIVNFMHSDNFKIANKQFVQNSSLQTGLNTIKNNQKILKIKKSKGAYAHLRKHNYVFIHKKTQV